MKAIAAASLLAALSAPAHAFDMIVGSTGTPDESCAGKVVFSGPAASLAAGASVCTLRYPITGPMAMFVPQMEMAVVRIRAEVLDNGDDARVMIRLKKKELGGPTIVRQLMDSDNREPSPTWQVRNTECEFYEMGKYVYWLEVDLIRYGKRGKPAIGAMRQQWTQCDSDIPYLPP